MQKILVTLGLLCVAEGSQSRHWKEYGWHSRRHWGPPSRRPTKFDFATKNPYWSARSLAGGADEGPVDEGCNGVRCEAVHIEHVGRHGSRYDDNDDVTELEQLLADKGSAIRNPQFAFIANWKNPFPTNVEKQLDQVGKEELYDMGHRYRGRYGRSALAEKYNPIYHVLQHTWKTRTSRSASAFALSAFQEGRGELGRDDNEPVAMYCLYTGDEDADGDKELRYADNCPAYDAWKDDDNSPNNAQAKAFEANMTEVVDRVAAKLDLDPAVWELDLDGVTLLYKACMFQTVIYDTPPSQTPCALFEERDYEIFAFEKDLGEYYENGYGDAWGQRLACPLLGKMVKAVKAYSTDKTDVQARFMFGHSDTIMPLLSHLGLHKDDVHLTADMPWEVAMQRKWRTGTISPMAANVALVLHRCENADGEVSWKTELRHNERRVKWPRCGSKTNVEFCSPDDIIAAYPTVMNCEYDTFCKL